MQAKQRTLEVKKTIGQYSWRIRCKNSQQGVNKPNSTIRSKENTTWLSENLLCKNDSVYANQYDTPHEQNEHKIIIWLSK